MCLPIARDSDRLERISNDTAHFAVVGGLASAVAVFAVHYFATYQCISAALTMKFAFSGALMTAVIYVIGLVAYDFFHASDSR